MSWREIERETVRGTTYITYRCSHCRKLAIGTMYLTLIDTPPSPCVCGGGPIRIDPASTDPDPTTQHRPTRPYFLPFP